MSTDIDCFQSSGPNSTPIAQVILHTNATSVTLTWTAVNAAGADGYVVYCKAIYQYLGGCPHYGNVTQYTLGGLVPGKTILNHWHQDPLFSHVLVIELYNYVHDVTLSHHTQSLPCLFILFTSAIFLISLENLLLFTCCFKVDSIIVVEMDSCLVD